MGGAVGDLFDGIGGGSIFDPLDIQGGFENTNRLADPLDFTGAQAGRASRGAQDAQVAAIQEANDLQRDLFNAGAGLTEYQRGIGNQALNQLGSLYGLKGGYNPAGEIRFDANGNPIRTEAGEAPEGLGTPDYSSFLESPDYLFNRDQGELGLGRQQSARGNLFSGGAAREASRFNQGLATQQLGSYTNQLARLAGIGGTATGQLNNNLQNTGNNLSNGLLGIGDARASGYLNAYAGQQQGAGNALSAIGTIGSFFCDRRLKTNIKRIGERGGVPWYSFDYIWGEAGEGPMADEVERIRPDLVEVGPNGFKMVKLEAL